MLNLIWTKNSKQYMFELVFMSDIYVLLELSYLFVFGILERAVLNLIFVQTVVVPIIYKGTQTIH